MAPRPLGLALSGGGFRATAFHLGVLKRLRELGVLGELDFLSTVSGGSIAGAGWVYWQSRRGDTISDADEWDRFETALIELMRSGLRETLIGRCLVRPFVVLSIVAASAGMIASGLTGADGVFAIAWALSNAIQGAPVKSAAIVLLVAAIVITPRGRCRPVPLLVIFSAIAGVAARDTWRLFPGPTGQALIIGGLAATIFALAYVHWHYAATREMARQLRRRIFGDATMGDLSKSRHDFKARRNWPFLVVNGTALNSGAHLLFTPMWGGGQERQLLIDALSDKDFPADYSRRWRTESRDRDVTLRILMGQDTPVATAVTASCALPTVFTPLQVADPRPWWEYPQWWSGRFLVADGGVADNQGIQVLLDGNCRGLIVSDAAAALRTVMRPSSWQLVPPGQGVVFRSQDIVYERMRDLGLLRIEERHEMYRLLLRTEGLAAARDWRAPLLEGYAFIETWPSERSPAMGLPKPWHPLVSSIRTDLNRFSNIEISALMFHGYMLVDECLRGTHPEWIPENAPPARFSSAVADIAIDWPSLSAEERKRHLVHLAGSSKRSSVARVLTRFMASVRLRRV